MISCNKKIVDLRNATEYILMAVSFIAKDMLLCVFLIRRLIHYRHSNPSHNKHN